VASAKYFEDWKSANKAMGLALEQNDRPAAAVAARAALALFKRADEYNAATHVALTENVYEFVDNVRPEYRTRGAELLFDELEHIYASGVPVAGRVVKLANTFGSVGELWFFSWRDFTFARP